MTHLALRLLLSLALLSLLACAAPGRPPVLDRSPVFGARPASYLVQPGDTLYSIAWRYGLDTEALAAWNGLGAPYLLAINRRLLLRAPPRGRPQRPRTQSAPPARPAPPPRSRWQWPLAVPEPLSLVREGFATEHPGLRFVPPAGRPARAAASGSVVYAGNGLGGFEHLIILRHADDLLSAYSFNGARRVREGAVVKVAQPLADISAAGSQGSLLYFEMRRKGSPIDPRSVIR